MPVDTAVAIETPADDVELELSPTFRIDLQPPPSLKFTKERSIPILRLLWN